MAATVELGTTHAAARLHARAGWPLWIGAFGMFAWWGTWNGAFIFDDGGAITDSRPMQEGDWWGTAFGTMHQPLANRPLAALSLVIDLALFGPGPFGPRLTNLVLHFCNVLLLFATLRRTLQAPNLAGRWSESQARGAAAAVALLWCVHPLGVDAVAYATQRSTLLFSGFLLLALYASLRAHASARPWIWRSLVVLALSGGMASKEDMLLAPVLVVLFERAFLLPSWAALRGRWIWYGALASSWVVLAACVVLGPRNPTVGSATGVTAWSWLQTQAGVVLHYVRLSAWPHPLRGAYDWGLVKSLGAAVVPGLAVLGLLGLTVACWWRRPWWGWLGALFFLLLAPTSTVMPIVTEIAAERRVYLPMLAVIVPMVCAGAWLVRNKRMAPWLAWSGLATAVVTLAVTTRARVDVYASESTFWQDAYEKREPGSRTRLAGLILTNHANQLLQRDRVEEALALYDESIRFEDVNDEGVARFAVSLLLRNRHQEAVAMIAPLARGSKNPMVVAMYGVCLVSLHEAQRGAADDPRLTEAEAALRRGIRAFLPPRSLIFWNSLGYVLRVRGRLDEALAAYELVTQWNTVDLAPWTFRAELLQRLGRAAEIPAMLAPLLAARPRDAALRVTLAQQAIARGDRRSGDVLSREALQLEPGNTAALAMQRDLETQPR